jgi:hypothetical protein
MNKVNPRGYLDRQDWWFFRGFRGIGRSFPILGCRRVPEWVCAHVEPGYLAADLFMIVGSAVRNDLDVFAYVKDVLDRLLAGETDYEALRPDVWRQAHPEFVRTYREEERPARANVKKARRARRRVSRK